MHKVSLKWLARKPITSAELARLIGCSEAHANSLRNGAVEASGRERAIVRLCLNVRNDHLLDILGDLDREYEWRVIPGYSLYEASEHGKVRRSSSGVVLKPKPRRGYLYVNLTPDDGAPQRTVAVHRAICLAFWGNQPTPQHVVCHWNDVADDNRSSNLYWGTQIENAQDKIRNSLSKSGPNLHHSHYSGLEFVPLHMKKRIKETMAYRLKKLSAKA